MSFLDAWKKDRKQTPATCLAEIRARHDRKATLDAQDAELAAQREDRLLNGTAAEVGVIDAKLAANSIEREICTAQINALTPELARLRGSEKEALKQKLRQKFRAAAKNVVPAIVPAVDALRPIFDILAEMEAADLRAEAGTFPRPPFQLIDHATLAGAGAALQVNPQLFQWAEDCDRLFKSWDRER